MTKELITEEYSYFSTVHIFRDVRPKKKKKKSELLQKTSVGSKSQRSAIQADKLPVRFYCFWPTFV